MNPAYVEWITMIKDDEEKLVHPGNVENHERAGWTRKFPKVEELAKTEESSKTTSLTLPELTEALSAEDKKAAAEAKKAAKKAAADAKKAAKKAAAKTEESMPAE